MNNRSAVADEIKTTSGMFYTRQMGGCGSPGGVQGIRGVDLKLVRGRPA